MGSKAIKLTVFPEFDTEASAFRTLTCAVPGLVKKVAGIVASRSPVSRNAVSIGVEVPPDVHMICETPLRKFVPAACSLIAPEPGDALSGVIDFNVGVGVVIKIGTEFDIGPVGLDTVI